MATLGGGGVVQLTQPQQRRVQWLRLRGGGLGREGRKALKRCLLSVRKLAALAEYIQQEARSSEHGQTNELAAAAAAALLPSCDLNAAAYFTCMTLFVIVVGPAAALPCCRVPPSAAYRRVVA